MGDDIYDMFYVGASVLVIREGKLLLGKRKNVFGAGTWALPGGHLEKGEPMTKAAARELEEETGLTAKSYEFVGVYNNPKKNEAKNKHYIQFGFLAVGVKGEPDLKEPERCYEWQWYCLEKLPDEIFNPHKPLINLYKQKRQFQDS